jgi:tetratricopeptide (TPR) repeat protein
MPRRMLLFTIVLLLSPRGSLWADDEVFFRGGEKPYKNVIKSESGLGLEMTGKKDIVPAEEIVDILYNVTPIEVRIKPYRPTFYAERKYFDPTQKKDPKEKITLAEILKGYADSYPLVKEKFAKRHLEYKIAYISVLLAQEEEGDLEAALQKLSNYKTKHADSWQVGACLRLLAHLQFAQKKYKEAQETYLELAAANVAPEVKLEGELMAAQVGVRAGKVKESLKKLDDILAKLPKDSRLYARARIARAESLAAAKEKDQAVNLLRQIIKESADKTIRAVAYNTVGEIYFQTAAYKEARWEFLKVEVVYNQDKNELAKALYYLAQIFDKLGDTDRAKEYRDLLIADRQFIGLEWQRLALQASKTP